MRAHVSVERKSLAVARSLASVPASDRPEKRCFCANRVATAENDPITQKRLDACVFKGAVKNRGTGKWTAVPVCAMNQERWGKLYEERLADGGDVPGVIKKRGLGSVFLLSIHLSRSSGNRPPFCGAR